MNYKTDILSKLTKSELLAMIPITGLLIEQFELAKMGATISENNSGPDGYLKKVHQEIKSQIFQGNYRLHGRGKYGAPSKSLYSDKIKSNEVITIVGSDAKTGEVYYTFQIKFDAIADRYLDAVRKQWSNYDFNPLHYLYHDSFEIMHIANNSILHNNIGKFQPKFFNFLVDVNNAPGNLLNLINYHYYYC